MIFKKDFSYLDQFYNQTIDLTQYIENIALKNNYPLEFSNLQPVKTTIKNLFYQTNIISSYKSKITNFFTYTVKDSDTIDYIAYQQYGSSDYWWIIAVFNDMISINPFSKWILSDKQLLEYSEMLANIEKQYPQEVYYNLLFEMNEKFRNIYIMKNEYLYDLIWDFRQEILKNE